MPHPVTMQIIERFPEVARRLSKGDDELPYLVMNELASWLASARRCEASPEVVRRLLSLNEWCIGQPSRTTAQDDAYTILVVGLYEKLMDNPDTHPLIPLLVPKEEFDESSEYYASWVSAENLDLLRLRYSAH